MNIYTCFNEHNPDKANTFHNLWSNAGFTPKIIHVGAAYWHKKLEPFLSSVKSLEGEPMRFMRWLAFHEIVRGGSEDSIYVGQFIVPGDMASVEAMSKIPPEAMSPEADVVYCPVSYVHQIVDCIINAKKGSHESEIIKTAMRPDTKRVRMLKVLDLIGDRATIFKRG